MESFLEIVLARLDWPRWPRKERAEMALKRRTVGMAERICTTAACESLRQLGWSVLPGLMLDTIELVDVRPREEDYPRTWEYRFRFTSLGQRKVPYEVLVSVRGSSQGHWENGAILVFHPKAPEQPWVTGFRFEPPGGLGLYPFDKKDLNQWQKMELLQEITERFEEFDALWERAMSLPPRCPECGADLGEDGTCPVCSG